MDPVCDIAGDDDDYSITCFFPYPKKKRSDGGFCIEFPH
jgi:hypothetical protein